MELKRINYKTIEINNKTIKFFKRIHNIIEYGNYLIFDICAIKGDPEFRDFDNYEGGNVFCYDSTGVLVWQWPEKGISGMRLIDQGFIDDLNREHPTADKDWVSLFRPEGQVLLQHAGPSYALLVDIASGKELDRWETR